MEEQFEGYCDTIVRLRVSNNLVGDSIIRPSTILVIRSAYCQVNPVALFILHQAAVTVSPSSYVENQLPQMEKCKDRSLLRLDFRR